jgi:hypothetical protein
MEGLRNLATEPSHRKELVAGNIDEYITSQFRESARRVGDDAGEFGVLHQIHSMKKRLSIVPILRDAMHELPQIAFALRAAQKPMTIPLSLASLALIEHASTLFMSTHFSTYGGPTIAMHFSNNYFLPSGLGCLLNSGMYRSSTPIRRSMLSRMFRSRLKLVSFA